MSFDYSKVQFTDQELEVAGHVDAVYELFKDGFEFQYLIQAVPHIQPVIEYFMVEFDDTEPGAEEARKLAIVNKIIDLAVMMKRDNLSI